jgi:hypothetical protein
MGNYEIRRLALGCDVFIPIDESMFTELKKSFTSLVRLLEIEQTYDTVVGNYVELEKCVLSIAIESYLRRPLMQNDSEVHRSSINRTILNLFTACRAYIDHSRHFVSELSGKDSPQFETLCNSIRSQYDRSLSYRVIEALRNYSQHCGLPTQSFSYEVRRVDRKAKLDTITSRVSPSLILGHLRKESGIKKSVLDELEAAHGHDVPLLPMVREYVSSLSEVNTRIRKCYSGEEKSWCSLLDQWGNQFLQAENGSDSLLGVAALNFDENLEVRDEVHFGAGVELRLERFRALNPRLVNLHQVEFLN